VKAIAAEKLHATGYSHAQAVKVIILVKNEKF
jgi:hypothetical protein